MIRFLSIFFIVYITSVSSFATFVTQKPSLAFATKRLAAVNTNEEVDEHDLILQLAKDCISDIGSDDEWSIDEAFNLIFHLKRKEKELEQQLESMKTEQPFQFRRVWGQKRSYNLKK